MNPLPKKIIAISATIVILIAMYFGAYLPLRKSQIYIKAMFNFQSGKVHSVEDFVGLFGPALNFRSPIGQDEAVSYYFEILANVINQQNNEQVIEILLKESEKWMEPILKAQKGFVFNQNLYNFATVYKIAGLKLKNEIYYQKSLDLFNEGLKYSPNRLIFLGGLYDLYQVKGDNEKMKEISEIVLKYYPNKIK
jgi:tetratricopeptide (TPR) repeat protein